MLGLISAEVEFKPEKFMPGENPGHPKCNSRVKIQCPRKIPENGMEFKRQNVIAPKDGSKGVKG